MSSGPVGPEWPIFPLVPQAPGACRPRLRSRARPVAKPGGVHSSPVRSPASAPRPFRSSAPFFALAAPACRSSVDSSSWCGPPAWLTGQRPSERRRGVLFASMGLSPAAVPPCPGASFLSLVRTAFTPGGQELHPARARPSVVAATFSLARTRSSFKGTSASGAPELMNDGHKRFNDERAGLSLCFLPANEGHGGLGETRSFMSEAGARPCFARAPISPAWARPLFNRARPSERRERMKDKRARIRQERARMNERPA